MAKLHPLKNSIYQQYEEKVNVLTDEIRRCERKAKWFVIDQLAAFILAISCIAIYALYFAEAVVIALSVFFLGAYIAVRRMDVANGDKMERLKAVRRVYANEMAYLNGDFEAFRNGKQYINPSHAYSFDMDVFGELSLFQRINRTVTSGGSDYLAAQLGSASTRTRLEIEDQRNAINELADDISLRISFIAVGQLRGDIINTSEVIGVIEKTKSISLPFEVSTAAVTPLPREARHNFTLFGSIAAICPRRASRSFAESFFQYSRTCSCPQPARSFSASANFMIFLLRP